MGKTNWRTIMTKKWADPLDRLLDADKKARSVSDYLKIISNKSTLEKRAEDDSINFEAIVEIDVSKIIRWKYKDRPENELGDVQDLSETFKTIGQQQPCILRPSKEIEGKYELIAGERRWRAAEMAGMPLKAIIQHIDDKTAVLIQAIENEKRKDISEYAKGMSYADKIEKCLITQKDLIDILGISKQQVSRLLSYKKIPEPLFLAIDDFRKVSSRTAYELSRLASKSSAHMNALIEIADKIRDGKCGQKTIEKEVAKRVSHTTTSVVIKENKKILSNDGRHLFTWRMDSNKTPSIHFPKDIINLINKELIMFDEITGWVKECIMQKRSVLNESPRGD